VSLSLLACVAVIQDRVFPLKKCMFVDAMFSCPHDPEYVLRENFGDDWRVPKPGFKTWMLKK
jgi:hypothetical protein